MRILLSILACLALIAVFYIGFVKQDQQPNIILIFTDDWGYGDLELHGSLDDVKTPNLNRLAGDGTLFTNAYVTSPQCSPSRAGLITGRYQQRFGLDSISDTPLPQAEKTIADRMLDAGYVTGMVGKLHLEPNHLSKKWSSRKHP